MKTTLEKVKDAGWTVLGILVFPPLGLQYIYLTGKCDGSKEVGDGILKIFDNFDKEFKKQVEKQEETMKESE
jgi:hypothetical protein